MLTTWDLILAEPIWGLPAAGVRYVVMMASEDSVRCSVAAYADIGLRSEQQDRVLAVMNGDGAWVIAVADGAGGMHEGHRAAAAALSAVPMRIEDNNCMKQVFLEAHAAVRDIAAQAGQPVGTTLAVAAWSPVGGLSLAWLGDSVPFLLPFSGERSLHGLTANAKGKITGNSDSPDHFCLLGSSDITAEQYSNAFSAYGGALVLATDGLYTPLTYTAYEPHSWLSSVVPAAIRHDADRTAATLLRHAGEAGFSDNAAVAVATFDQMLPLVA